MIFKLQPKSIFKALLLFTILLVVFHIVLVVGIRMSPLVTYLFRVAKAFDLDGEENVPALYSAAMLMVSALLLGFIAFRHRLSGSRWLSWSGLAVLLAFLSLDEAILIHEPIAYAVQDALNISREYYYIWAVPYTIAAGIVGLLYMRFLAKLPKKTRILFLFSAAVFIIGAAGFEWLSYLHVQASGSRETFLYQLLLIFEEFLEMFGVLVFVYALLDYITSQFGNLGVIVEDGVVVEDTVLGSKTGKLTDKVLTH